MVFDKNFLPRLSSSIILIILAIYANNIGGLFFLSLVFIITFLLLKEYYELFNISLYSISFLINNFFSIIILLFIFNNFFLLIFFPLIIGILLNIIFYEHKWNILILPYFYFALPLSLLLYLNNGLEGGKLIIYWLFAIVWATDTSAFIFGNIIKGPKLCPKISPNKTLSGFIFSLIIASVVSIFFCYLNNSNTIEKALLVGLITSFFTSVGDLFESWLKRKNNKKDVSKLIPGHGGLLDRLDGFLFAIVSIYLLNLY